MACIAKRGESYQVRVRVRNIDATATFIDESDAKLWGWYRERLMINMGAFSPPLSETITLSDAIDTKMTSMTGVSVKDMKVLFSTYAEWLELPLASITSEMIVDRTKHQLSSQTRRGGNSRDKSTGSVRQIAPKTVEGHLRRLSSVFGYMIEKGIKMLNPCAPALADMRRLMEQNK